METVRIEQAMKHCWEQVWPEVQAEAVRSVNVGRRLVMMRTLRELMRQVCLAGFRGWLEQADCPQDTLDRDGRTLRFQLASDKEFATPEVRELAAFLVGLITSEEAEQVLQKSSLYPVGRTTLQKLAGQFGQWLEEHEPVIADVRVAAAAYTGVAPATNASSAADPSSNPTAGTPCEPDPSTLTKPPDLTQHHDHTPSLVC